MEQTLPNFLQDMFTILYEEGLEAKAACKGIVATKESQDFNCGRLKAYFEVLVLLLHLTESFEIRDQIEGLERIDPYQLLPST